MSEQKPKAIYAVSGPTCSGKTVLGVFLCKQIDGEVINFDSVQIYRGIEIATAKPSEEEKQGIPHHLIDYVDPNVNYTAADWARDAVEKIREVESRGKVPVLIGGTGFYLRTLRQPLFDSPKTDAKLRERFKNIHKRRGVEHLYRMLTRIDPAAAARIERRDHVRAIRALEFYFQTGKRISEVQPLRAEPHDFASRIRLFVLDPPRDVLYERINARTDAHFAAGLVDEVKQLIAAGINESGNALGAHGYRRVCEYLRGERDLGSAIEKSKQDVRNYAKRQLTWFRREPDAVWLRGFGGDADVQSQLLREIHESAQN
ncbi:MAG: tRNA (adenosine(37)-N6)-dimethylallyltransferase MiaA [Acidobacteriota bacterium]|nr:MAG: tRNA (adenosine(37)-N6)-dimethylallyltransferase MiaA [Acidobacteriota bacterium]